MMSICVFCASADGKDKRYIQAAIQVGEAIAERGYTLIYGGGTSGLMGVTAAACLNAGGRVHGVIPQALQSRERFFTTSADLPVPDSLLSPVLHEEAKSEDRSTMTVVKTMHERKMLMAQLADAFISLPGGFGTLEELAEMTTWNQLGIHAKPTVLLNILDYYTPLRQFVQNAVAAGFISPKNQNLMVFADAAEGADPGEVNWGERGIQAVESWANKGVDGEAYKLVWA